MSAKRKKNAAFVLIILILIAGGCLSTTELKLYAQDPRVTDENSMFFYTNIYMLAVSMIWLAVQYFRNPQKAKTGLRQMDWKSLVPMAGGTICSNIGSIFSVWLIATMEMSIYSPVTSAIWIISGVAASLLFREKPGRYAIAAAVLAVVAVII